MENVLIGILISVVLLYIVSRIGEVRTVWKGDSAKVWEIVGKIRYVLAIVLIVMSWLFGY